jgi:DNA primase catalytic subunit
MNQIVRHFWTKTFIESGAFDLIIRDLGTCLGAFAFEQREVSPQVGESHWRNVLFVTPEQVQLDEQNLQQLQFGGIFPAQLIDHLHGGRHHDALRAVEREHYADAIMGEVVIDVDLDATVRGADFCKCGEKRRVCDHCWHAFMDPALAVLEYYVGTIWKFKRWFKVFSGRRGFHLHIFDERVLRWTRAQRGIFIDGLYKTSVQQAQYIYETFLKDHLDTHPQLLARMEEGESHFAAAMRMLYPRVDENVTRDASHLRKCPLTLHPSTKCVSTLIEGKFIPSIHSIAVEDMTVHRMREQVERLRQILFGVSSV